MYVYFLDTRRVPNHKQLFKINRQQQGTARLRDLYVCSERYNIFITASISCRFFFFVFFVFVIALSSTSFSSANRGFYWIWGFLTATFLRENQFMTSTNQTKKKTRHFVKNGWNWRLFFVWLNTQRCVWHVFSYVCVCFILCGPWGARCGAQTQRDERRFLRMSWRRISYWSFIFFANIQTARHRVSLCAYGETMKMWRNICFNIESTSVTCVYRIQLINSVARWTARQPKSWHLFYF